MTQDTDMSGSIAPQDRDDLGPWTPGGPVWCAQARQPSATSRRGHARAALARLSCSASTSSSLVRRSASTGAAGWCLS